MNFNNNVEMFWNWFQANVDRINKTICLNSAENLMEEISRELNKVFGDMPFLIGGGDGKYELILSPEGNRDKLYLSRYWREQAPQIPEWTFFHLKQPNHNLNLNLKLDNCDSLVGPEDFYVLYMPNDEKKKSGK